MSTATRQWLVAMTVCDDSQRADLLNEDPVTGTNTDLIALMVDVVRAATNAGCEWQFTAVRSDHHDDSALGPHAHAFGYAADGWLIESANRPGSWIDANDPRFPQVLHGASQSPWHGKTGLAGTAYTDTNVAAAGPDVFQDEGADHVHLQAQ